MAVAEEASGIGPAVQCCPAPAALFALRTHREDTQRSPRTHY
jgi:hypothetical protein